MKRLLTIFLLIFTISASGQIKIKFNNQTDSAIVINIIFGEVSTPTQSLTSVYTTTILAKTQSSDFIKISDIRKKKKFVVIGTIQGIGNFKYFETTVSERNQEFVVPLILNATKVPPDNASAQALLDQINFNPPPGSQKVMDAELAYKDYFGGLSLRKDGLELDRIEPTVLKADVSPVQFGSFSNTISIFLSGKFMTQNKATVPGIAGVGGNVSNEKLYKLTYNVSQIGAVVWTPPGGKSIVTLFTELNSETKVSLIKRFLADPALKLYQYDHVYDFKQLDLQIDSYTKTNVLIDVSVPVFLSSNTSFAKDDEASFHTNVLSTSLNIWAEKDVTYLLVQAAKDYLDDQLKLVQASSTNKDAQALIKNSLTVGDKNVIKIADIDSKQTISTKIAAFSSGL